MIGGLPGDPLHDVLEGVLQYEAKELIKVLIKVLVKEKHIMLNLLNERIQKLDFGHADDKNKPSVIEDTKMRNNDHSLGQRGEFSSMPLPSNFKIALCRSEIFRIPKTLLS